jgi:ferredoxin-NADP reductase
MAEVLDVVPETPRARTLVLRVPDWPGHLPGQHLDVRLTADDGYQAQRSYSIASAPETTEVALTVDRIEGGEMSPYLADEVRAGDRFEVRGPVGGYFVWTAADGGPLLLVSGGSGIVPLMAMLRHRAAAGAGGMAVPTRLLASWRSAEEIVYRTELDRLAAVAGGPVVAHALTRTCPEGWTGYGRRIDVAMFGEFGFPPDERPHTFVCGPTAFVEAAATMLVALGHEPARIKTERFGPGGG